MNTPVHIIEDRLERDFGLHHDARRDLALAIYNDLLDSGWHFLGVVPKNWIVTIEPKP
jgi:hypothetical protein